ncbi:PREDICTED: uncharacterized protein LOC109589179 [Amphimedon queenslandica]|uniref:Integrase catalytic domain-containing protein n=1 Tax=Amphimedon queenslandica TaxID=400682 RepID=A0A1X7T904_AMPQE|nr:PREDICTED: uncharacterized protein LOC109589179 [Amphimedon queenslandica]XP_019860863.1 PREDICTED: uncharacterized protein LOC109589179 [Amphimedon queenslandica]|eukprot:XP_019860862.1 PREDICTED: uncharacterized protein LOC109589179 [Amphimedon queenslandica]
MASIDSTEESGPAKGRPKVHIDRERMEHLRSLKFTWEDIGNLLGVSSKTIQRRSKEWGMKSFTEISDADLDALISEVLQQFPHYGEAMIRGHLHSQKVLIQRACMREAIYRVRGRHTIAHSIHCRTYSVSGPNALWHLDSNHKLIKWRLVVHGCVDGFTHLITFLKCSNNNRSDTVLECFINASAEYGLPLRVRTDYGGENVRVWQHIEEIRGQGRGSFIAGSSVHNSRIERLWRDVHSSVLSTYKAVFHDLEERGILDCENEADIFALHYVFIPRINKSLKLFQEAWNSHPLSTENNKSPLQLYHSYSQGSSLFDETVDPSVYGREEEENEEINDGEDNQDMDTVVVPTNLVQLSENSLSLLQSNINPLDHFNDNGQQIFVNTVALLFTLMQSDNLL